MGVEGILDYKTSALSRRAPPDPMVTNVDPIDDDNCLKLANELQTELDSVRQSSRVLEAELSAMREQTHSLSKALEDERHRASVTEHRLFVHPKSGLPNHHKLDIQLDTIINQHSAQKKRMAVAIIKLDTKFDMVVKTLKASVSEWLLYQIGMRLREVIQDGEYVYHGKDDEFMVVLSNYSGGEGLKYRLASVYDAVVKPLIFSGHHLYLGCNMGVALFPQHGQSKLPILHAADIALGNALLDRKQVMVYHESMRHGAIERLDLQNGIIRALEAQSKDNVESQFALHYQPQVTLAPSKTTGGRISRIDAEVLIRWNHPQRGLIPPDTFIPLAEETGLILPIGNWVMFKTIEQLERWQGTAFEPVTLSINISPQQFANQQLMDNLVATLRKRPTIRNRLKLEITETSLMEDPDDSISRMRYLNRMGIRFALDDFGKGYSSLNYLSELPLSTLKLDRAFISDVHRNKQSQDIVRAVVFLAQRMKLHLICEGIENRNQLAVLERQGCRKFQGYLFSKALKPADFETFYRNAGRVPKVLV